MNLAGVDSDLTTVLLERILSIVQSTEAISVAIVRKLCMHVSQVQSEYSQNVAYRGHPKSESRDSSWTEAAGRGRNGTEERQNHWAGYLVLISYQTMPSAVILKTKDFTSRLGGTLASLSIFVNVITKVDHVVVLVFSGSIAVRVKVTVG
jgi:hypothetical protein